MLQINKNIAEILHDHIHIAVVGLSDNPMRSSNGIARLMISEGYRVTPVNPRHQTVLGLTSYPALIEIPEPVDLVCIFRRAEFVDEIVDQAIEAGAKAVWMQSGIINEHAAQKALAAGIDVVMDRCWGVEFRKLSHMN